MKTTSTHLAQPRPTISECPQRRIASSLAHSIGEPDVSTAINVRFATSFAINYEIKHQVPPTKAGDELVANELQTIMKTKKIFLYGILAVVTFVLVGCKPKPADQPDVPTLPTNVAVAPIEPPVIVSWNNTNVPPAVTNGASTNVPAVTNQ